MIGKKFKVLHIMILTVSLLILGSVTTFANDVGNGGTVDSFKVWTIKFNQEVVFDEMTQNAIVVTAENGNIIEGVTLELGDDKKSIVVNPPQDGYGMEIVYSLNWVKVFIHRMGNF